LGGHGAPMKQCGPNRPVRKGGENHPGGAWGGRGGTIPPESFQYFVRGGISGGGGQGPLVIRGHGRAKYFNVQVSGGPGGRWGGVDETQWDGEAAGAGELKVCRLPRGEGHLLGQLAAKKKQNQNSCVPGGQKQYFFFTAPPHLPGGLFGGTPSAKGEFRQGTLRGRGGGTFRPAGGMALTGGCYLAGQGGGGKLHWARDARGPAGGDEEGVPEINLFVQWTTGNGTAD